MFRGGAHAITSSYTSWYFNDISKFHWFAYIFFPALCGFIFIHLLYLLTFSLILLLPYLSATIVFLWSLWSLANWFETAHNMFFLTTKKAMPYNKRVFHGIATRAFSAPKKHDLYCIQNDCTRCTGSVETLLDLFLWFNWEKQKFNQEWA